MKNGTDVYGDKLIKGEPVKVYHPKTGNSKLCSVVKVKAHSSIVRTMGGRIEEHKNSRIARS